MVTSPTAPFAVEVEKFFSAATPTAAGPTHTQTHTHAQSNSTHNTLASTFCTPRCFCVDCLDILVDPGASNNARYLDPWRCYMCQPTLQYGALKRRHDWSIKLQIFFTSDNGQEFVSRIFFL